MSKYATCKVTQKILPPSREQITNQIFKQAVVRYMLNVGRGGCGLATCGFDKQWDTNSCGGEEERES